MNRYSIICDKNPREIVLLRGVGCAWSKCKFCDYHIDRSTNCEENFKLNSKVLKSVTGIYHDLEVINSGSVFELDDGTLSAVRSLCLEKGIHTLHFESHYLYRKKIQKLRDYFSGINLKMKLGVETFDYEFREKILHKGIEDTDPVVISEGFDEANLLFGISGQNYSSMKHDIKLGLIYFERICVNIMCCNTTTIRPDKDVINTFVEQIYPIYRDNDRVDILLNNTDFGVGS